MEINVKLPAVRPPTEPLDRRQVVLLPASLDDRLVNFARERNTNVSGLLREIIQQIVDGETGDVRH